MRWKLELCILPIVIPIFTPPLSPEHLQKVWPEDQTMCLRLEVATQEADCVATSWGFREVVLGGSWDLESSLGTPITHASYRIIKLLAQSP